VSIEAQHERVVGNSLAAHIEIWPFNANLRLSRVGQTHQRWTPAARISPFNDFVWFR
jgi:hypothetical protein